MHIQPLLFHRGAKKVRMGLALAQRRLSGANVT
jgi:hypothetical protein